MSYPGYPPYQQGPGEPPKHPIPQPYQTTVPLSYPVYPGSAAPYPQYPGSNPGFNPSMPYPAASYPSTGSLPYPSNTNPNPAGAYPASNASYSSGNFPSACPAPNSYPSYPGGNPPSASPNTPYPSGNSTGAYPTSNSSPYPSGNPASAYPASNACPYPGGNPSVAVPASKAAPHPTGVYPNMNVSSPYPSGNTSHSPYPNPSPSGPGGYGSHPASSAPQYSRGQPGYSKGTPTLKPASLFDPRMDAEILRKAMKGFGTDEKAIINVLTKRTSHQRQEIAVQFKTLFGKDLVSDLKGELSGKFQDLVEAMMMPIPELLARELHYALSGVGTCEETLVEILCSSTNHEIRVIRAMYERIYNSSLERDLSGDTSGSFRRLLVSLCQGNRSENYIVDHMASQQDAQALLRAGEMRLGTDESTFNAILCSRSYPQLQQVLMEYQRLTGHDFERAISNEFSGDIQQGLKAIVRSAKDKAGFFAERLHESMAGMGTHDRALIRICVTRSEVDMVDIKAAFHKLYNQTLEAFIADDTSGDYKKGLLSLIA